MQGHEIDLGGHVPLWVQGETWGQGHACDIAQCFVLQTQHLMVQESPLHYGRCYNPSHNLGCHTCLCCLCDL